MKKLLSIAVLSLVTFSACAGSRFTYNRPAKPAPIPVVVVKPAPAAVKGLPAKSVCVIFDLGGFMAIGSATFTVYGPAPALVVIAEDQDIADLQADEGVN